MRINVGTPRDGLILDEARLERLRDGTETTDDPVLQQAQEALSSPEVEVLLDVTGPKVRRRVEFSVKGGIAAVVMSRPEQALELAAVTCDSIPAVIARATGLAPSDRTGEKVVRVPVKDLDDLCQAPYPVSRKFAGLAPWSVLENDQWRLAMMQVVSRKDGVEENRYGFEILGAADTGWWYLERGERDAQITPTRAAMMWGLITDLMEHEGLAERINPLLALHR